MSLKFSVYLVESPSPTDLYIGRSEGNLLLQAIQLNGIPCTARLAVNLEAFSAALQVGLVDAMNASPGTIPILHISAHGYRDGIQLTSGEILRWADLRELLVPLNEAFHGCLIVCMSTCEGYSGTRMAMVQQGEKMPFFALVGNCDKPTWPETAVGFATFYHLLAKGNTVVASVRAMQVASGNANFFESRATESQKGYMEYIAKLNAQEVRENIEESLEESPPDAKWSSAE
jgi:hypothetical protein